MNVVPRLKPNLGTNFRRKFQFRPKKRITYCVRSNINKIIAESEEAAQLTHPSGEEEWIDESWADPEDIEVELLGEAVEGSRAGVVCASFHAG